MKMSTHQPGVSGWWAVGFNVALNLFLPALILIKGGVMLNWPPLVSLLVALVFPFGWGAFELTKRGRYNVYSLVGVAGVVMTGGIGVLQLPTAWLAVKEAGVPLVIGLGIALSGVLGRSVLSSLLGSVIDQDRLHAALQARGAYASYQRILARATYAVATSFFLSAALNYILARWLVVSEPGTNAFNQEYGRLTLLSYPVIAGPTLLLVWLTGGWLLIKLRKLTGLPIRDLLRRYAA